MTVFYMFSLTVLPPPPNIQYTSRRFLCSVMFFYTLLSPSQLLLTPNTVKTAMFYVK